MWGWYAHCCRAIAGLLLIWTEQQHGFTAVLWHATARGMRLYAAHADRRSCLPRSPSIMPPRTSSADCARLVLLVPQDAFDWPSEISRMYKIRSSPRFLFFVDVRRCTHGCMPGLSAGSWDGSVLAVLHGIPASWAHARAMSLLLRRARQEPCSQHQAIMGSIPSLLTRCLAAGRSGADGQHGGQPADGNEPHPGGVGAAGATGQDLLSVCQAYSSGP